MKGKIKWKVPLVITIAIVILAMGANLSFVDGQEEKEEEPAQNMILWLMGKVENLSVRVSNLENMLTGPGARDGVDSATCIIGEHFEPVAVRLQNETILKHLDQYGKFPTGYRIASVQIDKRSGDVLVMYSIRDQSGRYVFERWNDCEFLGSSDWQDVRG